MSQADLLTAGETALDILGVAHPDRRALLHGYFEAWASEYLIVNKGTVARPRARDITRAVNDIEQAARLINRALALLLAARQTAWTDGDDTENCRRAIFPLIAEQIRVAVGMPNTDAAGEPVTNWDGGYEDPLGGVFSRMAYRVRAVGPRFETADFHGVDRSRHPALVILICRLGGVFEVETGRKPAAPRSGDRPAHQSQFERFVRAFAPIAGIEDKISSRVIAGALREAYPLSA
ncbi:hypothetical protein [Sphingobium fuliginis]|uniref:hypothetical protein n=1 Tax=Sphingobium fuliginis (strain ATCC 27551) TaxID=336203 RepID=UPI000C07E61E|nr:hypothetical protein [Sphingobium fuliginis]